MDVFAGREERRINICMVAKEEEGLLKDGERGEETPLICFNFDTIKLKFASRRFPPRGNERFLVILRGKQRAKKFRR